MSCPKCQPSEAPAGGVATMTGREPTIALVGNPNVGKSTLFNRITGARQRAVNAPGTTVQVATGHWRAVGARVLDLPGTYSLIATSPDEQVVTDTVSGAPGSVTDPNAGLGVDLILVILDGSSMTRSLYLLAQVAQTGRPAVAVVTMADVAEQNGEPVNVNALAKKLGIPVMAFDPRSGRDSAVLEQMIATALVTRPRVNGIVPDPNAPGYSADAAAVLQRRLYIPIKFAYFFVRAGNIFDVNILPYRAETDRKNRRNGNTPISCGKVLRNPCKHKNNNK